MDRILNSYIVKIEKRNIRPLWSEKGVINEIPENTLMSNNCLIVLSRDRGKLQDLFSL